MIRIAFNADAVLQQIARARAALSDMTPVYGDIGEYLVKSTRDRFRAGTAPDGSRWRAKSPATLAAYLRRGDGSRPDPLIGPSGRLGREIASVAGSDQVEVGSSLIYSGAMQFGAAKGAFGRTKRGGPIPWGTIPARQWLGLSAGNEAAIIDIVDEHLEEVGG